MDCQAPDTCPGEKHDRNEHIHCRSGQGYPEFLDWHIWYSFKSRQSPDREQGNVLRADAVAGGCQRVAKLVEHDAGEQHKDESYAFDHRRQILILVPVDQRNPRDHHEERGVNIDVDSGNAYQFP